MKSRREREKPLWADAEDLHLAKKISSMQGITMKEYFKRKVNEDIPLIKKGADEIERKYRGGDRFVRPPF